jgi:ubiquinone/menaquinone biosynthesis C-methylase UbiE
LYSEQKYYILHLGTIDFDLSPYDFNIFPFSKFRAISHPHSFHEGCVMIQTGSYNVEKFSTTSEGEIRRLDAQLDLFWKKEFALYTRSGLKDGMDILDAGSGPGNLSEKLLAIFPSSSVTSVEIAPSLVEFAQKRLFEYRNNGRSTVIQNSILKLDFPDNSFDFIITRLVIKHVPDPKAACIELYRVLKPGGTLIVVDNDFEMHVRTTPHIAELSDLYNAYCKARTDEELEYL